MLLTHDQRRREFTCKLRPENCKESYMLNYLFDCYFSASPILLTPDQPRREFTCKLRPENCKETDMLNYLFDCYFSASPMLLTPDQPRREFTCKLRPENCKETDMLNYLFDCYERVAYEERTAPKVRIISISLSAGHGILIGSMSAWHASGPEFDPHIWHILSWRLGHEKISTAI